MSNNKIANSVSSSNHLNLDSKGERRFVTVLFCDLVSVTSISNQVDPETLQQVLNNFHRYCGIAINRYGGNISQLLDDGLLAYFGFPFTYEDNAHRALRAALHIINGLHDLKLQLREFTRIAIEVRIGIDTGLVVTSEKQQFSSAHTPSVIGKTPNIAAKLQNMAAPNTILISDYTQRLVQGMFVVNNLGAKVIKGLSETIEIYQVLEETDAHSRFEAAASFGLTPFVGRQQEMTQVRQYWQAVCEGGARLMMLQGEPGIGKTRLIRNFQEDIAGIPHLTFTCQCSSYYQNTALYPFLSTLKQYLHLDENIDSEEKMTRISALLLELDLPVNEYLHLWAGLFSISTSNLPEINDSATEQKRKFAFSIIRWLEFSAFKQPMLLIVEDLHWSDPSTLDLIAQIIEQALIKNTLIILSCRPEFIAQWDESDCFIKKMERLSEKNTLNMISTVSNQFEFSKKMLSRLLNYSSGNPLFIEESTKMSMVESTTHATMIPDTLQDLLLARLELLGKSKSTAQLCAVLGKSFDFTILSAITKHDPRSLRQDIDHLLKAQLIVKLHQAIDNRYEFKHALLQEACYQSLLLQSRQECHLSIAKVLMAQFDNVSPEIIAYHCHYAKLYQDASVYWKLAGIESVKKLAGLEASNYFRKAIAALQHLPNNSERDSLELDIQLLLGSALTTTSGYASNDVTETFERAKVLCLQTNALQQLYSVLIGLWQNSISKLQFGRGYEFANSLLELANKFNDPTAIFSANGTVGITCMFKAEFGEAIKYLNKALTHYQPEKYRTITRTIGQDPGLGCMGWLMLSKELSSDSDSANQLQCESVLIARELGHAFSLTNALQLSCFLFAIQKKFEQLADYSRELSELSCKHGFEQRILEAKIFENYAQGMRALNSQAATVLHSAILEHDLRGEKANHPFFYGLLAEVYLEQQQFSDALQAVNKALDLVFSISGKEYWFKDKLISIKGIILTSLKIQQAVPAVS